MDALSEILRVVRLVGAIFINARFTAPWCYQSPRADSAAPVLEPSAERVVIFHFITEGECYVEMEGHPPMRLCAGDIKRVSLELGGKSPNIIFADADLEAMVNSSVYAVFGNAGQDCCARTRIFVERGMLDAFIERFIARTRRLRVGDPLNPQTEIGSLVSRVMMRIQGGVLKMPLPFE